MKACQKHLRVVLVICGMMTPGLMYAKSELTKTAEEAKTKLFELMEKDKITVNFAKGSAAVTESEMSDIRSLLEAARKKAPIERIIVATWSDKEYPATKGEALSAKDQELAQKRGDHLSKALNKFGVGEVEVYSMAIHPTWISKAFNTTEAKLKGEGQASDPDEQMIGEIGKNLSDKGGPGKAVVLVWLKGNSPAL